MRAAVKEVARHFPTAIVSGRCRSKVGSEFLVRGCGMRYQLLCFLTVTISFIQVFDFVKLSELCYAGSHGMDIKVPKKIKYTTKVGFLLYRLIQSSPMKASSPI